MQDAAGQWHELLFATQPLRLPGGTLAVTVPATIDIAEQLAAERAALDAKRMLDESADGLPGGVVPALRRVSRSTNVGVYDCALCV
ncbi:hypothetical protein [Cupriavidus yeoncheonensis]|uniref:hypothetical protein n=1 Tax=Cupriavidus yeoncheonensis TaxID=1462994 RepID=UPI001BAC0BC0|nr:hypothetical protein [Cupriavidus yeoncheonensis]